MGTSAADSSAKRGPSKSPKQPQKKSPRQGASSESKNDKGGKAEASSGIETTKPLAPPPRPGQQQDYFANSNGNANGKHNNNNSNGHSSHKASLSLEPNPFEQSFGVPSGPETPGGTKLPSVASLTSPSSLLPGSSNTPFNWGGGSLRTGPLSPAMLSGPTNDYFSDTHHLRGGFPTPNESSLRSGLTPGGSGSMFPAPSPNSQALFAQLASGGATPNTIEFHRTAMSAAAKREANVKSEARPASGPFDPHDNDAANGLFMLAQGRNGAPNAQSYPANHAGRPHPNNAPADQSGMMGTANGLPATMGRGTSQGSNASDDSEHNKPSARGKGKKMGAVANGRRKADEMPSKPPPAKKAKSDISLDDNMMPSDEDDDDDDDDMNGMKGEGGSKSKMTDEEKRKNFLERNRVAALKCRQRKKQWLANLQNKVEMFSTENDALTAQITQLREEVVNLKTLLLAHKDCPVTQQQGLHGAFISQGLEPYSSQMNPYGMAGPMGGQAVMAGQGVQRRFS